MWMGCRVIWEGEVDGSAGEQDQRESVLCGVESVGATDDQPHLVIQALMTSVREASLDRGDDAVEVFSDGASEFDELRDPAALRPTAPPTEHLDHHLVVEIAGEDRAQCLLEFI